MATSEENQTSGSTSIGSPAPLTNAPNSTATATATATATNPTSSKLAPTAGNSGNTSAEFEPPLACVRRILKTTLPMNTNVGKDASSAFSRACGIFVIYLTACANDFARESKRQTITAADVMAAIKELDFGEFTPKLTEFLEMHRKQEKIKRDLKKTTNDALTSSLTSASPKTTRRDSIETDVDIEADADIDVDAEVDVDVDAEPEADADVDVDGDASDNDDGDGEDQSQNVEKKDDDSPLETPRAKKPKLDDSSRSSISERRVDVEMETLVKAAYSSTSGNANKTNMDVDDMGEKKTE